jgi:hypothetical protein
MRTALPCVLALALCASCKKEPPPPPPPGPTVAVAPTKVDLTPPADAQVTASGLKSQVLVPGTGHEHPSLDDLVTIHYTGWKSDGTIFDSSRPDNAPLKLSLREQIKGWAQGIPLMVTGEKRRLWVPTALAYGEHPPDGMPAGPLVYEVELLAIERRPAPPPAPTPPPPGKKRTQHHR